MRSKSLIALAAAGALAVPALSSATGDYVQHRLAFVPHNTIGTSAYPMSQIQIDEFGGPVNPYIWEQPMNPNPWGPRELASVAVPAPVVYVAQAQPSAVVTQSSSGPDGSTVTWYFPDGTVAHQQYPMSRSEPSASSGSSFSASPGVSSGSSPAETGTTHIPGETTGSN